MKTSKWKQALFNKAYRGLAKQGFRRSMKDGSCMYRGDQGRRCAVGQLITDEHYNPDLEGGIEPEVVLAVRQSQSVCKGVSTGRLTSFLEELQSRHDGAASPRAMQEFLDALAEAHRLTVPRL